MTCPSDRYHYCKVGRTSAVVGFTNLLLASLDTREECGARFRNPGAALAVVKIAGQVRGTVHYIELAQTNLRDKWQGA